MFSIFNVVASFFNHEELEIIRVFKYEIKRNQSILYKNIEFNLIIVLSNRLQKVNTVQILSKAILNLIGITFYPISLNQRVLTAPTYFSGLKF